MNAGGLAADEQGLGDLLIRASFGDETEDFELAPGEAGDPLHSSHARNVEAPSSGEGFDLFPERLRSQPQRP